MFSKNLSLHNHSGSYCEVSPSNLLDTETSALFEDILKRNLSLRIKVTGRSMAPFLHGGEILTIKKVSCSSLHIGDLIFFKSLDGFPLLHRIVKKGLNNNLLIFQTKGDALFSIDSPVSENEILGKVYRIEKTVTGGQIKQLDLESHPWRAINYLLAVISLAGSKTYNAAKRCRLFASFRCIIKKVLT